MNHRPPSKHKYHHRPTVRKHQNSSFLNNSLSEHERASSLALTASENHYHAVSSKLTNFLKKTTSEESKCRDERFDWIRTQNALNGELGEIMGGIDGCLRRGVAVEGVKESRDGGREVMEVEGDGEDDNNVSSSSSSSSPSTVVDKDREDYVNDHKEGDDNNDDLSSSSSRSITHIWESILNSWKRQYHRGRQQQQHILPSRRQRDDDVTKDTIDETDDNQQRIDDVRGMISDVRHALHAITTECCDRRSPPPAGGVDKMVGQRSRMTSTTAVAKHKPILLRSSSTNDKENKKDETEPRTFLTNTNVVSSSSPDDNNDNDDDVDVIFETIRPVLAETILKCQDMLSCINKELTMEYDAVWDDVKMTRRHVFESLKRDDDMEDDEGVVMMDDCHDDDDSDTVLLPSLVPKELREAFISLMETLDDDNEKEDDRDRSEVDALRQDIIKHFQTLQNDYEESLRRHDNDDGNTDTDAIDENWTESDHVTFRHIISSTSQNNNASSSSSTTILLDRLSRALPHIPRTQLQTYHHHMQKRANIKCHNTDIRTTLSRRRSSATSTYKEQIKHLQSTILERTAHRITKTTTTLATDERKERLALLRDINHERTQRDTIKREQLEHTKNHHQQQQRRRRDNERQQQLQQTLQTHHTLLTLRTTRTNHTLDTERFNASLSKLERLSHNHERVTYRRHLADDKRQRQQDDERRASLRRRRRLAQLASHTARSVPYAQALLQKPQPGQERKPTKASLHHEYGYAREAEVYNNRNLKSFQRRDNVEQGYWKGDARLFRDLKFRLGHALHEAGVAQSDYARMVVKRLIPREMERTTGICPH